MYIPKRRYYFHRITVFIFVLFPTIVYGQVNTEKLRNFEAKEGLQNTAGFGLGFLAGNSEQYRITGQYRLDWLVSHYYSFLIMNYERGKSGGELFSDRGFVHARVGRDLNNDWILEAFAQKEFNKLISLKDRQVIGGGLRYEIRKSDTSETPQKILLGLGTGIMYERELTTEPAQKKKLVRSTNYLSLTWFAHNGLSFSSTTYFQMDFRQSSDFRVLDESSLAFSITKSLSFITSINLRFDHEPPPDIKKYDIAVTHGINVRF